MRFTIPTENIKKFQAKIGTLNKKAAKLGCSEVSVVEIKTVFVPTKASDTAIEDGHFYEAVEFEVSGEAPVINGWEFLARLDPTPAGNMIQTVPGKTVPPKYGQTGSFCDHCKTDRYRKKLYVLHQDGEHMQVGRTCLKDFMGHADPLKVAAWSEMLMDLDSTLGGFEDFGGFGGYVKPLVPVKTLLAVACRLIDAKGFKKSDSDESTSGDLSWFFSNPGKGSDSYSDWKKFHERFDVTPESLEKADKVIEFIKTMGDSNYAHNLKVSIENGYVDVWKSGLLASSVWVYEKEVEGAVNKGKTDKSNTHVGDVGERLEIELKLIRASHLGMSSFGGNDVDRFVYNFEDSKGNAFVWFTGKDIDLENGTMISVKGTVKNHNLYKETKQTILTRCKIGA